MLGYSIDLTSHQQREEKSFAHHVVKYEGKWKSEDNFALGVAESFCR
jgi:hypothetical protein